MQKCNTGIKGEIMDNKVLPYNYVETKVYWRRNEATESLKLMGIFSIVSFILGVLNKNIKLLILAIFLSIVFLSASYYFGRYKINETMNIG